MKKTNFSKYSDDDLRKELAEKRDALRTFRFSEAGSRSRNVREGRNLRKNIAQLLTEMNARRIAVESKRA